MSFGSPPGAGGGGPFGPPNGSNGAGPFGAPSSGPFGAPQQDPNAGAGYGGNAASSHPFGNAPTNNAPFGAPPPASTGGAFGAPAQSQAGGAFGAPQTGGAFGAPQSGGAFGAPQTGGAFGAPQTGGAFGAPQGGNPYGAPVGGAFGGVPTNTPRSSAGSSVAIVASVIGVIGVAVCGIGFSAYSRAQVRRAQAIRDLNESLARARTNYNYGSNTYGSNTYNNNNLYNPNAYRPNTYNPTPNPYSNAPAVPGMPSFVSNTGNRNLGEITPILLSRIDAYRSCIANDPMARGSMGVRFMIGSNGRVLTAFASPTSGSSTADTCVTGLVRSLSFRPAGGYTILIHPLTLR